jgi:nucleoside 2-deoxyribosyltransferase
MKFYIASSLKNTDNVRMVASELLSHGWVQTYDWTKAIQVNSISQLREIGREEMRGVLDADLVIVMIPAGKGSHVELGLALGAQKKVLLYSADHDINNIENTCSFYQLHEVVQCIGTLEELITAVTTEAQSI